VEDVVVRAYEIWNPAALDNPSVVALFARAFADPKFGIDADDVRGYLKASLSTKEPTDKVFVASSTKHGYCGLSIVTLETYPLSPLPWVTHFVAEKRAAREPLVDATLKAIAGAGFTRLALHNATGASDLAHMRLFRRHVKGAVMGSLIIYELEKADGGK
jgi:hypothetical protein